MSKSKSDSLRKFLSDHQALSLQKLAEEAGIPRMSFYDLNRGIDLPEKHWPKLLQVLKRYGWE